MNKTKKILIGTSTFAELYKAPMDRLTSIGYEVIENPFKRKLTKNELKELLDKDVEGLIAGLEPLDYDVLNRSNLKVISRVGSGLSNVDLKAAAKLGIKVCYTPDGPTKSVAELTIGAMLSMLRMIPQMDKKLHDGIWCKKIGEELHGKIITIVGYGRIGSLIAQLLKPFNVNIIIVDPYKNSKETEYPVLLLEDALPQSEIVTIHSNDTQCLLGDKEFDLMKRGIFLLNAARGELISEQSLIKALDNGVVAGAWLDTFSEEPYNGDLTKYEQVILTPHIGSYTFECRKQMETEAVENLIKYLL